MFQVLIFEGIFFGAGISWAFVLSKYYYYCSLYQIVFMRSMGYSIVASVTTSQTRLLKSIGYVNQPLSVAWVFAATSLKVYSPTVN